MEEEEEEEKEEEEEERKWKQWPGQARRFSTSLICLQNHLHAPAALAASQDIPTLAQSQRAAHCQRLCRLPVFTTASSASALLLLVASKKDFRFLFELDQISKLLTPSR